MATGLIEDGGMAMAALGRSRILAWRRAASWSLMLAIASGIGSICILVAHLAEWAIEGSVTHVTIGGLIRVRSA